MHIAHNVLIGENTVIAGQTGIAGSTNIGSNVMIGGQVGIAGHLKIGNKVKIGAQAGVTKNIENNISISGTPAVKLNDYLKQSILLNKMVKKMSKILDVEKILEMMPHRYPFLLLDRLIKVEKDEFAIGLKNVTINEPFFLGHFPKQKVMPGVLIVECMAQTSGALVVNSFGDKAKGKLVYFMSIEKARFRKLVTPGDQLIIEVKKKQARKSVWKFECTAKVDDEIVSDATITAMIVD